MKDIFFEFCDKMIVPFTWQWTFAMFIMWMLGFLFLFLFG